jgi:methionyl-tRNA formyltransferase
MNIVFFGTSEFALPALRALAASPHRVLALVTQPDRRRGRSLKVSPPPTKVLAAAKGIPVYQPQDASSAESVAYLKRLGADVFTVVSFGPIL